MVLTVQNNGQEIIETNFWQTDQAGQGAFYLSINAGAFRLLVPERHVSEISEFNTAKDVILTRGPWPETGQDRAMEILFDDGTDEPYLLCLGTSQVDRWPTAADENRECVFSAWILKDGKPNGGKRACEEPVILRYLFPPLECGLGSDDAPQLTPRGRGHQIIDKYIKLK